MPCYESNNLPAGVSGEGRFLWGSEEGCLGACQEGACCAGSECTIKPQCKCAEPGMVFFGVGKSCKSSSVVGACCDGENCSLTPPCECPPSTGKVFKGMGTKCEPNPCVCVGPGIGKCCGPETTRWGGKTYLFCRPNRTKAQCDAVGGRWSERACCSGFSGDASPSDPLCEEVNPLP